MSNRRKRDLAVIVVLLMLAFVAGNAWGVSRHLERADLDKPRATATPAHAPLATTIPTSTEVPIMATPIPPTPEPSDTPERQVTAMDLGDTMVYLTHRQPFEVSVLRASQPDVCPGGQGRADAGAKLVELLVSVKNVGDDYDELPPLAFRLMRGDHEEFGKDAGGKPCLFDDQAWSNACNKLADGGLWPGTGCQGWLAMQVPEGATVNGLSVEAFPASEPDFPLARWRLGPAS
jgi:hypothetical protein